MLASLKLDRDWMTTLAMRVVLCLMPFITLAVMSLVSGNNCFAGRPVWSDEVDYWREMLSLLSSDGTFGSYGFFGYPAEIGQLGCHGIAALMVYWLPGMAFGWELDSIVIWNAVSCCVAFVVFVALLRPDAKLCALASLLWLLSAPILSYAPSSMMELPQYAGAIICVALFIKVMRDGSGACLVALFCFVFLYAGIRVSNIIFFIPAVLAGCSFKPGKRMVALALVALVLSIAAWIFYSAFNAIYPYGFMRALSYEDGLAAKGITVLRHIKESLILLFSFDEGPKQTSQRYVYVAFLLCCFAAWILLLRKGRGEKVSDERTSLVHGLLSSWLTLGAALAIVVGAYDVFDWRDYRTLAPVLWSQMLVVLVLAYSMTAHDAKAIRKAKALCLSPIALTVVALLFAIPSFGDTAAFEPERYAEPEGAGAENAIIEAASPLGPYASDRTVIFIGGTPDWAYFGLQPEMGCLPADDVAGVVEAQMAYICVPGESTTGFEGYDAIAQYGGYMLYARS
ncbi:MAG: hypothetical protein HFJ65_02070 [Eggerthellaceae bacterium]|nr:hypothetical protein [Eggerthellaceae bacterium]